MISNPLRPGDGWPDDLAAYIEARAAYGLTGNLSLSGFAAWHRLDSNGSTVGLGPLLVSG